MSDPVAITASIEIAPWDTWITALQHRPDFGHPDDDDDCRVDCSCGWHWNAKTPDARWEVWIAHVIADHMAAALRSTDPKAAAAVSEAHHRWALQYG